MKPDRVWMNLFRLVRIPVSLALDEHAKQYLLALFPGWSPRLQQFHMYSLRSFLVCIQVLSAVKVSLLWPILYKKVCTFTMCEVKRNRRSTKSLSSFLAFLYIAIKCLRLWNGQGLPSVWTLTWHLVLNKTVILFVQFHQNQPNSRVACMISPLYVATPWTYRHLLSCGGNEWFDVFMNILCSSHWNQAEHPCLHKYKKSD